MAKNVLAEKKPKHSRVMVGEIFGRLKVIERTTPDPLPKGVSRRYWKCVCDCGKYTTVSSSRLRRGVTKSCGCLRADFCRSRRGADHLHFKHGLGNTVAYHSWKSAKNRCFNPVDKGYPSYGGRGITMCKRWADDFLAFVEDMGLGTKGLSLDRIDNDKGYEPGNCRWATVIEQSRNKRTNRKILYNGSEKTAPEWSEISGVNDKEIRRRFFDYGWSAEKSIFTPTRKRKRKDSSGSSYDVE